MFEFRGRHKGDIYSEYDVSRMILRDHLAADRTILSNQNTFLAYVRTALTLFVAGVTFVRFFELTLIEIVGWVFMPLGVITFLVGLYRYNKLRRILRRLHRHKPK
jgi:putative membrane protein